MKKLLLGLGAATAAIAPIAAVVACGDDSKAETKTGVLAHEVKELGNKKIKELRAFDANNHVEDTAEAIKLRKEYVTKVKTFFAKIEGMDFTKVKFIGVETIDDKFLITKSTDEKLSKEIDIKAKVEELIKNWKGTNKYFTNPVSKENIENGKWSKIVSNSDAMEAKDKTADFVTHELIEKTWHFAKLFVHMNDFKNDLD